MMTLSWRVALLVNLLVKSRAILTLRCFWSSLSRCGIHFAGLFFSFNWLCKTLWTVLKLSPVLHEMTLMHMVLSSSSISQICCSFSGVTLVNRPPVFLTEKSCTPAANLRYQHRTVDKLRALYPCNCSSSL